MTINSRPGVLRAGFAVALMLSVLVHPSRAPADSGGAAAATPAEVGAGPEGPPRAGLEFLIVNDLTLAAFDGALVSWRTRRDDGGGWRFGADLGGSAGDHESRQTRPDTTITSKHRVSSFRIDLVTQRLMAATGRHGLGFYWGLGPMLGSAVSSDPTATSYPYTPNKSTEWHAGLAGTAGVEVLVADRFSILAEYGLAAEYVWSKREFQRTAEVRETIRDRSFTVSARQVRLGLTAWYR